jgi:hypothetical protein
MEEVGESHQTVEEACFDEEEGESKYRKGMTLIIPLQ